MSLFDRYLLDIYTQKPWAQAYDAQAQQYRIRKRDKMLAGYERLASRVERNAAKRNRLEEQMAKQRAEAFASLETLCQDEALRKVLHDFGALLIDRPFYDDDVVSIIRYIIHRTCC